MLSLKPPRHYVTFYAELAHHWRRISNWPSTWLTPLKEEGERHHIFQEMLFILAGLLLLVLLGLVFSMHVPAL
jgi:hypothetical protein